MTPQAILTDAGWPGMTPEEEFAILRAHGVSLQSITDLHMTMTEDEACARLEEAIKQRQEERA